MTSDNMLSTPRSGAAMIDEARCIGCTLCLQACPYDAIVGAAQWMHTVITDACTGCELCLPPCPVDCIEIVPAAPLSAAATARTREREQARTARLATSGKPGKPAVAEPRVDTQTVERALARARARLSSR
jgi:electron transport complex protein RnfB